MTGFGLEAGFLLTPDANCTFWFVFSGAGGVGEWGRRSRGQADGFCCGVGCDAARLALKHECKPVPLLVGWPAGAGAGG